MPGHAGFAAAITIRERVLNDSLLLSFHAGKISHWLTAPIPDAPPDAFVSFFFDVPHIQCTGSDPGHMTLFLQGWGNMSLLWNNVSETRNVQWEMQLVVVPRFVLAGTELSFAPNQDDIVLNNWAFTVLSGGPYSTDADLYLRSGIFRNRLQHAVQLAITSGLLSFPPIDVSFLGAIADAASMSPAFHVVAGALILGLDITSGDYATAGNPQLLADFARNNDVAVITNPSVLPVTLQDAKAQVTDEVSKQGATLESLLIAAEEGQFRVTGRASNSDGAVNFTFVVIPQLFYSQPGAYFTTRKAPVRVKAKAWPALGFSAADPSVDVQRASWITVVEVISGLIAGVFLPVIIEILVRGIIAQITDAVATGIQTSQITTPPPPPRVQTVKALAEGDPAVRVKIQEFEIHTDGVFTGVTVRPQITPAALIGLTSIPTDLISSALKYEVRLPLELLEDDPNLRVRWVIMDLTTGAVLKSDDNLANGRVHFEFVPEGLGLGTNVSKIGILCRVYRTLGPDVTDFLNDGITLDVHGPLPPGAYVRWRYDVKNPQLQFDDKNNVWRYTSDLVVHRWSAIHRTDKPCKNAGRRSRYEYLTEFLDELPFPADEVVSRRKQLCDYCFFGGPGRLLPSL